MTVRAQPDRRGAVLIAARNEEPVIEATLDSVLVSYAAEDVFVVDDASTDATAALARRHLPEANVIRHDINVGKSQALEDALQRHIYPGGYEFVTIVDADTTLESTYRERAMEALEDEGVICAAGQVKSRTEGASLISLYRACLYFIWQAVFKRLLSTVDAIAIAPGCSSTWRTSALARVQFEHRMSTEDFHLTVSAHRLALGRIKYVHGAVVWTQDPQSLRAFVRQAMRWSRAWWEAVRFHRLGLRWVRRDRGGRLRLSGVDIAQAVLVTFMAAFFIRLVALAIFLLTPLDAWPDALFPRSAEGLAVDLLIQLSIVFGGVMVAAIATGRPLIIVMSPLIVLLTLLEFLISMAALASVLRRQFRPRPPRATAGAAPASAWESPERRPIRSAAIRRARLAWVKA